MNRYDNWKRKTAKFLIAQTISLFGSSLVQYAIIWYITLITASGSIMTIATICGYVPQMIISMFAGVWLDRYSRKKLIIAADSLIACSTGLIAILFLIGYQEIWLLFILLIIRSMGTGVQTPAVNAFLPQIVPKDNLMKVNGINSMLSSITIFLSPAVSGLLLTITSIELTFFIDVITAFIGVGITLTISEIKKEEEKKIQRNMLQDIKEGMHYLQNHKPIKQQLIYIMIVAVLISPAAFLTPLLVSRAFGQEVWKLTVSQMVFSFGAIVGGALISIWGGFQNRRDTIIAATIFYGMMMIGIGIAPIYGVYLLFNGLIGISMPCYNAPVQVFFQENVEEEMQGRVFGMLQIANACALPFGTVLFGPLADIISVQTILILTGIVVVLYAIKEWKNKK